MINYSFSLILFSKKIGTTFRRLLRKALFTQDILTHNIVLKRYCDKKDVFEPWVYVF